MTRAGSKVKATFVKDDTSGDSQIPPDPFVNRRGADRVPVAWSVECETADTFLYASIRNISEMGIFVATREPLAIGTKVTLRFSPARDDGNGFVLSGVVQWVNPVRILSENRNPGMGIQFVDLTLDDRERLVEAIHTIAYLLDVAN